MKKILQLSLFVIALFTMNTVLAQTTIKGSVVDGSEPLIGASVFIKGTTSGTQTGLNGEFEFISDKKGIQTIVISYIGYLNTEKEVTLNGTAIDLGKVNLKSDAIGMKEMTVIASVAKDRETPVAMSTVSAEQIALSNNGNELPEALNTTPAVYATKSGGGFGDSRINIRGFDQSNVAVLINGVPVNDMENGWVYWSNWAGIGDAVKTMQVQRGLGASKLAINSVGGTMNIITKTTDAKKGGSFEVSATDYGKRKAMMSLSSGKLDNGWAFSFVGSRTEGQSYVDGTYIDAWSYFGSVAKEIGDKHLLQLTIIGAPQQHGQRDNSQYSATSYADIDQVGRAYNPNWGYAKGEFLNERNNYYHKPQTALNWYWNINDKSSLNTSAYVSWGSGGGSGILGRSPIAYGPGQNAQNQRDWDHAIDMNDTSTAGAYLIMRNSVNNHFWTGALSTYKNSLTDKVKFIGGLDARYYKGEHYREVRDLLGADYWEDKVTPEAKVGDRIAYDNDGTVFYTGLFGQLEYATEEVSTYAAVSVANTQYGRTDRYNFARGRGELEAEKVNQMGYNAKAGANWNITDNHNVFVSGGIYSRAPFHNFVYINYGNDINPDISNENITSFEAGYGYTTSKLSIKVNGYYTNWADKWTKTSVTDPNNGERGTVYFQGLDELHVGGELEATYKVNKDLEIGLFGSVGNWVYTKDAPVTIYDDDRNILGTGTIYSKDLKVGDAPQQQFGAKINYVVMKNVTIGGSYVRNEELYAKFDPATRQDPNDRSQSYKLPGFGMTNGYVKFDFPVGKTKGSFTLNANNIFDVHYAQEGWDNAIKDANGERTHGQDNFVGFWGWGRNFNFALKLNF
jgi:outer membrane receptor protein involved in Fe transport